nr:hypothetical protein [Tanacetum cinerariifolium]
RLSIKNKKDKPEPTLDDSTFNVDLDVDHGMDYMDTEEPVNEGRLNAKVARLVYKEELEELEREKEKRQKEEEASKAAIAKMYDEVQAGIKADELFVAKLQQEERKEYKIEERAKFLAKTIAAQRKFRAA